MRERDKSRHVPRCHIIFGEGAADSRAELFDRVVERSSRPRERFPARDRENPKVIAWQRIAETFFERRVETPMDEFARYAD